MTITVHCDDTGAAPAGCRYAATDDDRYDGAPDASALARCTGWGATPEEAIDDYWRLHDEIVADDAADSDSGLDSGYETTGGPF